MSLIAGDTFRAAAVEQLRVWGERSAVRRFAGADGCDSAGLCFDGLKRGRKAGDDVVFVDTAGRLQNKNGLMDELKKVVKVMQKSYSRCAARNLADRRCDDRAKRFVASGNV